LVSRPRDGRVEQDPTGQKSRSPNNQESILLPGESHDRATADTRKADPVVVELEYLVVEVKVEVALELTIGIRRVLIAKTVEPEFAAG